MNSVTVQYMSDASSEINASCTKGERVRGEIYMCPTILIRISGIFKHVSWLYAFIKFFTCANVNACARVKKSLLVRKVKNCHLV